MKTLRSQELSGHTEATESQSQDHATIQVGTAQEEEASPVPYDQLGRRQRPDMASF